MLDSPGSPGAHAALSLIAGGDEAARPNFVCSSASDGHDAAWVHTSGQLDMAGAPLLESLARDALRQASLVVLDLRKLGFIDSSGVHAIVDASDRARRAGRRLIVLRGPPNVDRVFTLIGCSKHLELVTLFASGGEAVPTPITHAPTAARNPDPALDNGCYGYLSGKPLPSPAL